MAGLAEVLSSKGEMSSLNGLVPHRLQPSSAGHMTTGGLSGRLAILVDLRVGVLSGATGTCYVFCTGVMGPEGELFQCAEGPEEELSESE